MGCIVGRGTAEILLSELSSNKNKIKEIESFLAKPSPEEQQSVELVNLPNLLDELQLSFENYQCLAKYFPLDQESHTSLSTRHSEFKSRNSTDKAYIVLKLQESDCNKRICESFVSLMEKLKKIDKSFGQKISSKSLSTETILNQGSLMQLIGELQQIKEKQIHLSSYRGGNFEEITLRVNKRFQLDKDIEVIQTKLEAQQYLDILAMSEDDCKELNQEITDLRNTKNDLERAWDMVRINTKSNDKEIAELKEIHEELQPRVDVIEEEVLGLRETKADFETKMEEILRLQAEINDLETTIGEYQKLLIDTTATRDEASAVYNKVEKLKKKISERTLGKENLSIELKVLEESVGQISDSLSAYEEEKQKVEALDGKVNEFAELSLGLSDEITSLRNLHRKKLQASVAIRLKNRLSHMPEMAFTIWKWVLRCSQAPKPERSMFVEAISSEHLDANDLNIDNIAAAENKELLETNDIMLKYSKSKEKPMGTVNLFKFLEELMDRKYESDVKDLKEGRTPRTMTEYVQEHLSRVFGIPKIAKRQLMQIVPALRLLHEEKDPYGTLYCRLFQIFDSDPIHMHFAIYLTKVRAKFQEQIEKFDKSGYQAAKNNRKSRGKEMVEEVQAGGFAFLTDVIEMISSDLFKEYKQDGIVLIRSLRPEEVTREDYVFFMLCHKIIKTGKSGEALFNLIDKDGSATIDRKELLQFTRFSIEVWVDEADLDSCFSNLFNMLTEIPKEEFKKIFNPKTFLDLAKNKVYLVSKARFLKTIDEMHKKFLAKELASLGEMLHSYPSSLSRDEFRGLLKELNPEMRFNFEKYINEAMAGEETVSHQNVFKVISKHGLGNYKNSPFAIKGMYEELEERKVKTVLDDSMIRISEFDTEMRERSRTANK